ncbi:MAG: hypothetical protein KatS3mg058_1674 [Roseiflexus sp.]|jgi:hypothetical protein|nr:MAG: hypothetical protein KatS3mg058_1674 [Roseiflexus sp.]
MRRSVLLYAMAFALESLAPWLTQYLPDRDPVARRHCIHPGIGMIAQQSLLRLPPAVRFKLPPSATIPKCSV